VNEPERMQFFYEMFDSSLRRLGPGTEASTLKALDVVLDASPKRPAGDDHIWPRLLDLGCGTGAQALVLARRLDGEILAVDSQSPNLDALRRRAEAEGVDGKIVTQLADMRTLEFAEGAFDVIWSEGALFCMGFREGLAKCRPWLVESGFLAVTELCWLRPDPPPECRSFLEGAYPVIADIDSNLDAMRACGYTVLDHFTLPESAWKDEFYDPLERRLQMLRGRYAGDRERLDMVELIQVEIVNYRKYSAYYGYVFYVMRR
jgi:SAM-dependent methyltransferase